MTAGFATTRYRPRGTLLIRNWPFSSVVEGLIPYGAPSRETIAPWMGPPPESSTRPEMPPVGVRANLRFSFFSSGRSCVSARRLPFGGVTKPVRCTLRMNRPAGRAVMANLPWSSVVALNICELLVNRKNTSTWARGKGAPVTELVTVPDIEPFPAAGACCCGWAIASPPAIRPSAAHLATVLFRWDMYVLLRGDPQIFHHAGAFPDFDLFRHGAQRFGEFILIISARQVGEVIGVERQNAILSRAQAFQRVPAIGHHVKVRLYLGGIL